ncbi:hypothetical protein EJ08DRAFT_75542 [Tothia fuscella]|uniref:F-box domain-containing protein n=1 Tax=Tothia fuscella TaxID=1048955 RepID=A0A9P4U099_9PEZI|nr:hypothetical protein EJ08DRAFT_75542 [Tothia fuscella]
MATYVKVGLRLVFGFLPNWDCQGKPGVTEVSVQSLAFNFISLNLHDLPDVTMDLSLLDLETELQQSIVSFLNFKSLKAYRLVNRECNVQASRSFTTYFGTIACGGFDGGADFFRLSQISQSRFSDNVNTIEIICTPRGFMSDACYIYHSATLRYAQKNLRNCRNIHLANVCSCQDFIFFMNIVALHEIHLRVLHIEFICGLQPFRCVSWEYPEAFERLRSLKITLNKLNDFDLEVQTLANLAEVVPNIESLGLQVRVLEFKSPLIPTTAHAAIRYFYQHASFPKLNNLELDLSRAGVDELWSFPATNGQNLAAVSLACVVVEEQIVQKAIEALRDECPQLKVCELLLEHDGAASNSVAAGSFSASLKGKASIQMGLASALHTIEKPQAGADVRRSSKARRRS